MTKQKQGKKLTGSLVKIMEAKLNGTKSITILGEFEHKIQLTFLKTDVQKLIIEYYTALQEMGKNEEIDSEIIINASALLNILMIKYFTDIPVEAVGVEALIKESNAFNNLGIFDEVFDNEKGFSEDQINYVSDRIQAAAKSITEQYAEMVANPELAKDLKIVSDVVDGLQ